MPLDVEPINFAPPQQQIGGHGSNNYKCVRTITTVNTSEPMEADLFNCKIKLTNPLQEPMDIQSSIPVSETPVVSSTATTQMAQVSAPLSVTATMTESISMSITSTQLPTSTIGPSTQAKDAPSSSRTHPTTESMAEPSSPYPDFEPLPKEVLEDRVNSILTPETLEALTSLNEVQLIDAHHQLAKQHGLQITNAVFQVFQDYKDKTNDETNEAADFASHEIEEDSPKRKN